MKDKHHYNTTVYTIIIYIYYKIFDYSRPLGRKALDNSEKINIVYFCTKPSKSTAD